MSDLAAEVLATARQMNAVGINRGAAGNVSVRDGDGFIITPTGMAYDECRPQDMVRVKVGAGPSQADAPPVGGSEPGLRARGANSVGAGATAQGRRQPSSEWRFHRDIYAARPEAGAILHAHAPFATALACQSIELPPFHYMIARFGGDSVRCARYATFGTQELSDAMLDALRERRACLMAHHGMAVFGADLKEALALAVELESLCEQYWRVLQLGAPILLPADEMARVIEKFRAYGRQD
ncbi:MAG: class II aldolase/adducin family protein [Sulfuritalea sp.]|nr:class II aldolase/adducin family protein [Sulfuritalea sp.]